MKLRASKYLGLVSLFLVSLSLFAQQETEYNSYVILQDGTQIRGEIKQKFDVESYSELEFITETGERKVYKPNDIQAFSLGNGRFFRTETIPSQSDLVFVQELMSGSVALYKWSNKYYLRYEDRLIELKTVHSSKTENGKIVNVTSNQYVGVLKLAMNDDCGTGLHKEIESTKLSDRDLIKLFTSYYNCNNQPFEVHVSQVPLSKLSLKIQGGVGFLGLMEYESNKDVNYKLDKTILPYFEVGLRFKEFRNAPRLMVDLGIGYMAESNTLIIDSQLSTFKLTGREKYESFSVLVPIQLSYIVFKQGTNQVYTGGGLTFWFTKFDADLGELSVDNGTPNPNVIESTFIDRKEKGISPNLKIGYRNQLSAKTNLFVELKGDFLIKNMFFYPLTYNASYNYVVGALTFGIEL
ncbi:hypothetical protein J2X69_001821 [Algoriphagus sp. 4150]|uniref:hypothetical protein n=1 Tax=Algoriphagus sp. 4150 TaxID=2817756 RepID=UPI0028554206|nr:hypothetical protein [Algoriphagus sp. 4150]MDR7129484.1 hypothetical protein [Algoriphagus sp. 4150]